MKNIYKIFGVITLTIFTFSLISCQPQSESDYQNHTDSNEQYADAVPLIYHMSFIQRYSTKLYFSGMEENWDLADIYAHEIEEISEVIIDGNHMDDEVNVSNLLQTMLPPEIEKIEAAIDARDKAMFERNFQNLVQTCNKCHDAANYGAVKITVPGENPFAQDFSAD